MKTKSYFLSILTLDNFIPGCACLLLYEQTGEQRNRLAEAGS